MTKHLLFCKLLDSLRQAQGGLSVATLLQNDTNTVIDETTPHTARTAGQDKNLT